MWLFLGSIYSSWPALKNFQVVSLHNLCSGLGLSLHWPHYRWSFARHSRRQHLQSSWCYWLQNALLYTHMRHPPQLWRTSDIWLLTLSGNCTRCTGSRKKGLTASYNAVQILIWEPNEPDFIMASRYTLVGFSILTAISTFVCCFFLWAQIFWICCTLLLPYPRFLFRCSFFVIFKDKFLHYGIKSVFDTWTIQHGVSPSMKCTFEHQPLYCPSNMREQLRPAWVKEKRNIHVCSFPTSVFCWWKGQLGDIGVRSVYQSE